jgi:N-acetylgalactosamine-N,N'-diacetylbacillosaminyl-diphospho-undecaprenol 4-alpha-N-acetylgalactosaminyltransferase
LIILLYPHANKIIVNSLENAENIQKKINISNKKIHTIYNPMNVNEINYNITQKNNLYNIPKNKTIFITIGRLDNQKRTSILIKLFAKKPPPNAILLIIGDGINKTKLTNMIKRNNLENTVFLLGRKKNVFPYLKHANFFIFSSKTEGFPNVLMEAMFCNLPIITSDFKTGAREIIDEKLDYNQKIKYPYYGPNGVLLSIDNFITDFTKINFDKLHQNQQNIKRFNIKNINNQWINIIEEE